MTKQIEDNQVKKVEVLDLILYISSQLLGCCLFCINQGSSELVGKLVAASGLFLALIGTSTLISLHIKRIIRGMIQ